MKERLSSTMSSSRPSSELTAVGEEEIEEGGGEDKRLIRDVSEEAGGGTGMGEGEWGLGIGELRSFDVAVTFFHG
jgi:hypothetical protein